MKCAAFRELIERELDGDITSAESRSLEEHVRSCAECRIERQLLLGIDGALRTAALERAPRDLARSVSVEIVRRAEVRRRFEQFGVPGVCLAAGVAAAYGVSRAVNWETARALVRGLGRSAGDAAFPLTKHLSGAPDSVTTVSQEPAAMGVVLALAVAAVLFIGFSTIRFARHHDLAWR